MTTRIPESRHSHKKPPPRRAAAGNMLLTLLLVATWAGSTAGTTVVESAHTDESIERAPILSNNSNLRRAKGGDPSAFSKVTHDLLESILVRVKALEDENERLRGAVSSSLSSIPSPRNLQAATAPRALATTTPVTLMQLNQFKRSVTTQLATLNQSLQSTRALVDAFKVEVNDQLGQVRADLRAAQDSLVGIGNKTEKTEERTNDLEEALKGVAGRINTLERTTNNFTGRFGTLETTIDNFTSRMDQLTTQVEDGSDTLSGAVSRLDATSQEVSDLVGRLACIDASSSATDVVFSGCNVHVRNGAGQTTTTNGFGNIIVGYNERIGSHDRTGSHMVVVGPLNSWKGHAGIVVGSGHRQESGFASIIGGMLSSATGEGSVVVGGISNSASGEQSVAVAGTSNRVNANQAMSASGRSNTVDGHLGLAAGGSDNTVAAVEPSSSGLPVDSTSVVVGGSRNTVNSVGNALIGGFRNAVPAATSRATNVVQIGGLDNIGSALDNNDVGIANTRFAD